MDSINTKVSININFSFQIKNISIFKIDVKMADEFRPEIFGETSYYFDNLMETVETKNRKIIDLDFEPRSFHTLPNGNLVITSSFYLKIYDKEFKLFKKGLHLVDQDLNK